MSATNTPNQGFPLAQLSDPPSQIGAVTFPALAAAADAKANQLDLDAARVSSPNLVKISCSLGYTAAADTNLVGMQFDTVEYNRGTPTDLSVYQGLLVNRGFWIFGAEVVLLPPASLGNARDILTSVRFSTADSNPGVEPAGPVRIDLTDTIQTVGFPNFFTPVTWGWPRQYLNGCSMGLVTADGLKVSLTGLINTDVPYATLWAVQLGDV